jgi:flagellar biosynthesis/type III secretory pathway protein FliH
MRSYKGTAARSQKAAQKRREQATLKAAYAAELAQDAMRNDEEQQECAERRVELATQKRILDAYQQGKTLGNVQGYKAGYEAGTANAQRELQADRDNLNERQTELGSAACVIDSMAKVVDAGADALATYFHAR